MVSASDLKVKSSSPGRFVYIVFLGKTLNTVPFFIQVYKWEPANCFRDNLTECWQVTCDGLVSHQGGVEILLASRFILQKLEINAGPDELLARPIRIKANCLSFACTVYKYTVG